MCRQIAKVGLYRGMRFIGVFAFEPCRQAKPYSWYMSARWHLSKWKHLISSQKILMFKNLGATLINPDCPSNRASFRMKDINL